MKDSGLHSDILNANLYLENYPFMDGKYHG